MAKTKSVDPRHANPGNLKGAGIRKALFRLTASLLGATLAIVGVTAVTLNTQIKANGIELVDANGRTIATARSDYDGFFLFERVAYGSYGFRVAAASAGAARMSPLVETRATVSSADPVARLGAVRLRPVARVALAKSD